MFEVDATEVVMTTINNERGKIHGVAQQRGTAFADLAAPLDRVARVVQARVEAHAPDTEYFLYLIDESSDYPKTEKWAKWLNDNPGPGRRLKSMATIPLPEAVAHTPSLKVAASVAGLGITDQWEGPAKAYTHDPQRRFFLYNGGRPAAGTFCTEDDGVALRVNAWIQYKKQINRWFYWESTYYNDFQGGSGKLNLFQSAHTFGPKAKLDAVQGETGGNYSNGDGVLFYPGLERTLYALPHDAKEEFLPS